MDEREEKERELVQVSALEQELPRPLRPDQVAAVNSFDSSRNKQTAQQLR